MKKIPGNTDYPKLIIGDRELSFPFILGPMGVGVSLSRLVAAFANEGGAGILSVVCLREIWSQRLKKKVSTYEAVTKEIATARALSPEGVIGLNVMVAVQQDYADSIRAAVEGQIDFISIGAGLIRDLPKINHPHKTAIAVIVSSAKAANIVLYRWEKNKWRDLGYELAAFIVEGPLAGGHLGFTIDQVTKPEFQVEVILPEVKKIAQANGNIPVIAAGGIYDRADISRMRALGADGVQMATRFLATEESDASLNYKLAIVRTTKPEDIIVSPGSPCGLPFRVVVSAPMYQTHLRAGREPRCNKGYLLRKDADGKFTICSAKTDNQNFFCICNGLLASAGYNPQEEDLYTAGANAYRVTEISTVKKIMDELKGLT
ncbi:MAG: nitronate monooxygenase [Candidatus Falkowbacteria bacterium]|nr:nitronate monooxygenase [Candidatus Falkowbacteria bacterium]